VRTPGAPDSSPVLPWRQVEESADRPLVAVHLHAAPFFGAHERCDSVGVSHSGGGCGHPQPCAPWVCVFRFDQVRRGANIGNTIGSGCTSVSPPRETRAVRRTPRPAKGSPWGCQAGQRVRCDQVLVVRRRCVGRAVKAENVLAWDCSVVDESDTEVARINKTWAGWARRQ